MRILYYAHHHGSGHRQHARRLQQAGVAEVLTVGASGTDVELPPDVDPGSPHTQVEGSPFHWTPTTPAVRRRFSLLHRTLDEFMPDLVMVDVSVEAAVFCHLAGYPVAHRRMPGHREDAPHELVHALSTGLFAYYPEALETPGWRWGDRTSWIGMLSSTPAAPASMAVPGRIAVLSGAGGRGAPLDELVRAANECPDREWHVLGPVDMGSLPREPGSAEPVTPPSGVVLPHNLVLPRNLVLHGWVGDPLPLLSSAELVVCGAGHNTIATLAGLRRPVLVIPEGRPHDEQVVFADRLARVLGVPSAPDWREVDWSAVLVAPGDPGRLAEGLLVDAGTYARRLRRFAEGCVASRH